MRTSWWSRDEQDEAGASALLHPLFLASLVVLLVNDHVLKGAGILPGWLTGKLSDLGGLVVAPVLLAELLGARRGAAKVAVFAAVGAGFALFELSAGAAEALQSTLRALGMAARVTADPTDLLALGMLWPAWRIGRIRPQTATWMPRVVSVVGAAACIATSAPVVNDAGPGERAFITRGWLVNATGATLDVRVRWPATGVDCQLLAGHEQAALTREAFNAGSFFQVAPGAVLPLDQVGPGRNDVGLEPQCAIVMLQLDGRVERVFVRAPRTPRTVLAMPDAGRFDPLALVVSGSPSDPSFELPSDTRMFDPSLPRVDACGAPPAPPDFVFPVIDGVLRASRLLPDGCREVEVDGVRSQFVCLPDGLADALIVGRRVSTEPALDRLTVRLEGAPGEALPWRWLELYRSAVRVIGLPVEAAPDCLGAWRATTRGPEYAIPGVVSYEYRGSTRFFYAGDTLDMGDGLVHLVRLELVPLFPGVAASLPRERISYVKEHR